MPMTDVIVVGAGPAGLSAAAEAATYGLQVLLLDEQNHPGGQIYRGVSENVKPAGCGIDILGEDYWRGRELTDALHDSNVEYVPGSTVWTAENDPPAIGYMVGGRSYLRPARHIIIATGAYERPVPIPGWTLPGVMTAGAAQILMKSDGAALNGRIILAGSGPLLMLVTCQLLMTGANIAGLLETTRARHYLSASRYLPLALGARKLLQKGLSMRSTIKASGIPIYPAVSAMRGNGAEKFEEISFKSRGRSHSLSADLLLLHEGVVPQVHISRLLNLQHEWHRTQRYWKPVLSEWGVTSSEKISIVGDGGGIDGARAAEVGGRIAALHVIARLRAISTEERDKIAAPLFSQKRKEKRIRPLLDHLYRPPEEILCPTDPDTVICRCEEVDVREIRDCIRSGCEGPNMLKAYSRCGMGPCQGRMCGLSVSEIIASQHHKSVEKVGYYRVRTPIKPIPLSALATLETDEDYPAS